MIKDGIVYRNLENQVEYLTDYLNTEAQLVELGIKVVGTAEKREDIPEGQYEYGDAYMIGTSEPYIMWVWTRADRTHPQDYWFEAGPFPMPGPQGPKGDGLEQINKWTNGTVNGVIYNTTDGAKITQTTTINYTDSTDGSTKHQQFDTTTTLPIVPGKYISMNATSDNKKMEVKVDDTALALDYYKIDKSDYPAAIVPIYYKGKQGYKLIGYQSGIGTLVMRGGDGEVKCDAIDANYWRNLAGNQRLAFTDVRSQLIDGCFMVLKTATDIGSLSTSQLTMLKKLPQYQIQYNNKTYYRIDPLNAPDGTLNYIHIDSIDDGNGGYKATGKCFSIKVSTRAWKVIDLNFGGQTTHNLRITDNTSGNTIYFQISNNKSVQYTTADATALIADVKGKALPCTVQKKVGTSSTMHAGTIQADAFFYVSYGETLQTMSLTASQITIVDNL